MSQKVIHASVNCGRLQRTLEAAKVFKDTGSQKQVLALFDDEIMRVEVTNGALFRAKIPYSASTQLGGIAMHIPLSPETLRGFDALKPSSNVSMTVADNRVSGVNNFYASPDYYPDTWEDESGKFAPLIRFNGASVFARAFKIISRYNLRGTARNEFAYMVLFTIKDGLCTLGTTNGRVLARYTFHCDERINTTFALPTAVLRAIIEYGEPVSLSRRIAGEKKFPAYDIRIELNDEIFIYANNGDTTVPNLNHPSLFADDSAPIVILPVSTLRGQIRFIRNSSPDVLYIVFRVQDGAVVVDNSWTSGGIDALREAIRPRNPDEKVFVYDLIMFESILLSLPSRLSHFSITFGESGVSQIIAESHSMRASGDSVSFLFRQAKP